MVRIVICDDEIHIREGLKKAIEQMDSRFEVAGLARNGDEASKIIARIKPDLVLMDINMPGKNGLDVMKILSDQLPDVKYIIISGYDEFSYARKAFLLGATDYLLKPIDKRELHALIKRLAGKKLVMAAPETTGLAERIRSYIEENYKDPDICLSDLALKFHVSESYVTRVIKKECGKSYTEFLNILRLEEAKRILENSGSIQSQEVAERAGYLNKHYFCRIFKQYTGSSPMEYQKNIGKTDFKR